jgi:hypothetical protein
MTSDGNLVQYPGLLIARSFTELVRPLDPRSSEQRGGGSDEYRGADRYLDRVPGGQLNETLVQAKDSERRLKEMAERRRAVAPGLDIEDRCRSLVTGWLASRLGGYLPLGEVDEVYRKTLFDADDQSLEP